MFICQKKSYFLVNPMVTTNVYHIYLIKSIQKNLNSMSVSSVLYTRTCISHHLQQMTITFNNYSNLNLICTSSVLYIHRAISHLSWTMITFNKYSKKFTKTRTYIYAFTCTWRMMVISALNPCITIRVTAIDENHFASPYPAEHRQPDWSTAALTARIAELIDNIGFNGINIRSLRNSRN